MANYADYNALTNFLEESFSDKKDEIKSLNKYYKNGRSFLYGTYDFRPGIKKRRRYKIYGNYIPGFTFSLSGSDPGKNKNLSQLITNWM